MATLTFKQKGKEEGKMLLLLWSDVASLLHETAPVVPETVVQGQPEYILFDGIFKNLNIS